MAIAKWAGPYGLIAGVVANVIFGGGALLIFEYDLLKQYERELQAFYLLGSTVICLGIKGF